MQQAVLVGDRDNPDRGIGHAQTAGDGGIRHTQLAVVVDDHDGPDDDVRRNDQKEEEAKEKLVQSATDPAPRHLLGIGVGRVVLLPFNCPLVQAVLQSALQPLSRAPHARTIAASACSSHHQGFRSRHVGECHRRVVDNGNLVVPRGRVKADEDLQPDDEVLHQLGHGVLVGVAVKEAEREDAEHDVDGGHDEQGGQVDGHDGQSLCGRGHGVQDEAHEHPERQ